MKNRPLVSVIVPTKNSVDTIEVCLKSISQQSYKNMEIIIVDNNSEDGTKGIAKQYGNVFMKGPERSSQRNFGSQKAKGELLLFIDSDMELMSKVVEECVEQVQRDKAVKGIIITEISIGKGFWPKCRALERSCYIGDDTIEAARFFDREIFCKFNGYDEEITGQEDWDLPQRIKEAGYKIARIKALIKHLEGKLTLGKSLKKKYLYGKTVGRYIKKHRSLAKKQFTLLRPAYLRNWKRLAEDPIHTVGFIVMKICEFGAGGMGFFKSKMK